MTQEIIDLDAWWMSHIGQHLLSWEQTQMNAFLPNMFGYHALQIGTPHLDALLNNRMHDRWLGVTNTTHLNSPIVTRHSGCKSLFCVNPTALPFQNDSIDLIVLPHTLDWSTDAHATLREAARVVRPEGRVILLGFNPLSLWAIKQLQTQILSRFFLNPDSEILFIPHLHRLLGHWRILDWLRLLDFEVEELIFGIYEPGLQHKIWIQRWSWINNFSQRWWPMFGAVYLVIATKKVRSMRLLGPAWHRAKTSNSVASTA